MKTIRELSEIRRAIVAGEYLTDERESVAALRVVAALGLLRAEVARERLRITKGECDELLD